jgi:soluble lytic murein transglycosylase-like protein
MPQAKSPAGACGLTQVMPKYVPPTCKQLQNDVELSLQTGAIILSMWLEKKKTYKIALQCYNSGYKCKNKTYANNILKTAKILEKTYNLTRRKMENALN